MVLVPQVVDEVAPLPVVAAGGIADGRGLAAALALGAQGVNVGTRFIASEEAELSDGNKACVVAAGSDQTVRAAFVNDLVPLASEGAYPSAPRVVRNAFIEEWQGQEEAFMRMRDQLSDRMRAAMADGTVHELMVITGEVAGAIEGVLPAAEIVRGMAAEAENVLRMIRWRRVPERTLS